MPVSTTDAIPVIEHDDAVHAACPCGHTGGLPDANINSVGVTNKSNNIMSQTAYIQNNGDVLNARDLTQSQMFHIIGNTGNINRSTAIGVHFGGFNIMYYNEISLPIIVPKINKYLKK